MDAIFGSACRWQSREVGTFGLHYGQRNASSDNVDIIVHGRSGHGAYPAGGVDAIVVAAQVDHGSADGGESQCGCAGQRRSQLRQDPGR